MGLLFLAFALFSLGKIAFCRPSLEPQCSRFDYDEKILEKMVRMEHANELMLEDIKGFTDQTKRHLESMEKGLEDNLARIVSLEEHDSIAPNTPMSYAFSAYWLTNTSPAKNEVIIFTRTIFDKGGVYNNSTGKFTAPVSGIYLFTATLCPYNTKDTWVHFVSNGNRIGAFMAGDKVWNTCSSGSTIASLQKGANVWIRGIIIRSGTVFRNNDNQSFNGFAGSLLQMSAQED